MPVVLTYTKAHDLSQLHDELRAEGLFPLSVEGLEEAITLTMPDGTVEAEVDAVVDAHVPRARVDPTVQAEHAAAVRRRERVRGDYQEARALVAAATTVEELRDATLAALDRLQR